MIKKSNDAVLNGLKTKYQTQIISSNYISLFTIAFLSLSLLLILFSDFLKLFRHFLACRRRYKEAQTCSSIELKNLENDKNDFKKTLVIDKRILRFTLNTITQK